MASDKDKIKQMIEKVRDLNKLEDDPRIKTEERTAIDFVNNANWDVLKSMRTGVHDKREFTCLGVSGLYLRPLCSGEKKQILSDLTAEGHLQGTNGVWELEYTNRALELASTKHPDMKDEPFLSRATLEAMPDFLVEELSRHYIDYIRTLESPIDQLSEAEVKEYINVLEKKPHLLSDLPYTHKEQIMSYLIKQLKTLTQQVDSLLTQS